jgi:hypothetical protein
LFNLGAQCHWVRHFVKPWFLAHFKGLISKKNNSEAL